jgi:hypothetical protein
MKIFQFLSYFFALIFAMVTHAQEVISYPFTSDNVQFMPRTVPNARGIYPPSDISKVNKPLIAESFDTGARLYKNAMERDPKAGNHFDVFFGGATIKPTGVDFENAFVFLNRKFKRSDFPILVTVDFYTSKDFSDDGYIWIGDPDFSSYCAACLDSPQREGFMVGGRPITTNMINAKGPTEASFNESTYSHYLSEPGKWSTYEVLFDIREGDLWVRSLKQNKHCVLAPPYLYDRRIKNITWLDEFTIGLSVNEFAKNLKVITKQPIFQLKSNRSCAGTSTDLSLDIAKDDYCYKFKGDDLWVIDGDTVLGENFELKNFKFKRGGEIPIEFYFSKKLDLKTSIYVDPSYKITQEYALCEGRSVSVNGVTYSKVGEYQQKYQTKTGCDSIINIKVTVGQVTKSSTTIVFCKGDSVYLNKQYFKKAGVYIQNLRNVSGCDSILEVNVIEKPQSSLARIDAKANICKGEAIVGSVEDLPSQVQTSWYYKDALVSNESFFRYEPKEQGQLRVEVIYQNGCTQSRSFEVDPSETVNPYFAINNDACEQIVDMDVATSSIGLTNYLFKDGDLFYTGRDTIFNKLQEGSYILTRIGNRGKTCESRHSVALDLQNGFSSKLIPNILKFSSSDNHRWCLDKIVSQYDMTEIKVSVFNRWGNLVYKSEDLNSCWEPSESITPNGVYIVKLQYKVRGCPDNYEYYSSSLTVLR